MSDRFELAANPYSTSSASSEVSFFPRPRLEPSPKQIPLISTKICLLRTLYGGSSAAACSRSLHPMTYSIVKEGPSINAS